MDLAASDNLEAQGQLGYVVEAEPVFNQSELDRSFSTLEPHLDRSVPSGSLKVNPSDINQDSSNWLNLDTTFDLVNSASSVNLSLDSSLVRIADLDASQSSDDLTGFRIDDGDLDGIHATYLQQNLSPLLSDDVYADNLLVGLDAGVEPESLSSQPALSSSSIDSLLTRSELPVAQTFIEPISIVLDEDQYFSLHLDDLFPGLGNVADYRITPLDGQEASWLSLDKKDFDFTFAERVVIESIFRDEAGSILTSQEIQSLSPGSLLFTDLVVSDTRDDGMGLLGLELDIDWASKAARFQSVEFQPGYPLFQTSGVLEHDAGSLTGLMAAAAPSGGKGVALGDQLQDIFATLTFEVSDLISNGFDFSITPIQYPTIKNQPLDSTDVVSLGSTPKSVFAISGLPDQDLVGSRLYDIDVLDDHGNLWRRSLNLNIQNTNDAPSPVDLLPLIALEDQPFSLELASLFTDSDLLHGDQLTFRIQGIEDHWLSFDDVNSVVSGLPDQTEVGQWTLLVEATDLSGAVAVQSVDLTIQNVNDPPRWTGDELPELLIREGQDFSFELPTSLFVDSDPNDTLQYSLTINDSTDVESWLQIDPVDGVLSGFAPAASAKPFDVVISASDSSGLSDSTSFAIRVVDNAFNRPPYIVGDVHRDHAVSEGEFVSFDLNSIFRDDDQFFGDFLSFDVVLPDWLYFDAQSGLVTGLASNNDVGSHTLSLRATDSLGASAVMNISLDVSNVNQAPVRLVESVEAKLLEVDNEFKLDLESIFNDIDIQHGDQLDYTLKIRSTSSLGIPDWLNWNSSTGELILNPATENRGLLSLDFIATDQLGESSSYQLNLGIVSDQGLVEVNRSLEPLLLAGDEASTIDLRTAFMSLRENTAIDYSYELFRRSPSGTLSPILSQSSDWITLIDRSTHHFDTRDLITIEPVLSLIETGELIDIDSLSDLEAGTLVNLSVNISDRRIDADLLGLTGLDLQLSLEGLSLPTGSRETLSDSISNLLPLFRSVELLESDFDQSLRISAASLPSMGIGEIIGDEESETFFSVNLVVDDPLSSAIVDLELLTEDQGGLGYGLADGSSADNSFNIVDITNTPWYEIALNPTSFDSGLYALSVSAAVTHDKVSQIIPLTVDNGLNNPVTLKRRLSSLTYHDNQKQYIDLDLLFEDIDGENLSYEYEVLATNATHQAILKDSVAIVYRNGHAELEFNLPGATESIEAFITLKASDQELTTASQTFSLYLNPRSELTPLSASPEPLEVAPCQIVGIADLFTASSVPFLDTEDDVSLVVNSSSDLDLKFSKSFQKLAGLTDAEINYLEKLVFKPVQDKTVSTTVIPLSALASLSSEVMHEFNLNWIEIKAPVDSFRTIPIEISTYTHVDGDATGSFYGFQQSEVVSTSLTTSSLNAGKIMLPTTQRYLSDMLDLMSPTSTVELDDPIDPNNVDTSVTPPSVQLALTPALTAWKTVDNFDQSFTGDLDDVSSIVCLSVSTPTDKSDSSKDAPLEYELSDLSVRSLDDAFFDGSDLSQSLDPDIIIEDSWDPLSFRLSSKSSKEISDGFTDSDPNRDGVQVVVDIDLMASDLMEGDLNAYRKFVSQDAIDSAANTGFKLYDLDGNPILQKGWYDFTQRTDDNGVYIGDGARFIVEDINGIPRITKILLTLTDNSFGDNNMTLGLLDDPGMPVKVTSLSSLSPDFPQENLVTGSAIPFNTSTEAINTFGISSSQLSQDANLSQTDDSDFTSPESVSSNFRGLSSSMIPPSHSPSRSADMSRPLKLSPSDPNNNSYSSTYGSSAANTDDPFISDSDDSIKQTPLDPPINRNPFSRSVENYSGALNDLPASSNPLRQLFDRLMSYPEGMSSLSGLMLGMVATPVLLERGVRSLLGSGLGRAITVQRRNIKLQASWNLIVNNGNGTRSSLLISLENGQLSTSQPIQLTDTSQAIPLSIEYDQGVLWKLISLQRHPGATIDKVDVLITRLTQYPLDSQEFSWLEWFDSVIADCSFVGLQDVAEEAKCFRRELRAAMDVDPAFADSLMLVQLLDCSAKINCGLSLKAVPNR